MSRVRPAPATSLPTPRSLSAMPADPLPTAAPLVNRVAASGLLTLKLDTLAPPPATHAFDLGDYLWQGLALREKDFRAAVGAYDWSAAEGKVLCVYCSADAIIPQWAYMLLAAAAGEIAADVFVGTPAAYDERVLAKAARELDLSPYRDQRVVIKGCTAGRDPGAQAYATIMHRLRGVARSVMYGEPCSTVPIYKRPLATE